MRLDIYSADRVAIANVMTLVPQMKPGCTTTDEDWLKLIDAILSGKGETIDPGLLQRVTPIGYGVTPHAAYLRWNPHDPDKKYFALTVTPARTYVQAIIDVYSPEIIGRMLSRLCFEFGQRECMVAIANGLPIPASVALIQILAMSHR